MGASSTIMPFKPWVYFKWDKNKCQANYKPLTKRVLASAISISWPARRGGQRQGPGRQAAQPGLGLSSCVLASVDASGPARSPRLEPACMPEAEAELTTLAWHRV